MKTNKEYPATHSMATSWFAVDIDGEVAFIEYDEEGPIPLGTPPECNIYSVLLEAMDNSEENIRHLNYTKEQVQEILKAARPADKEDRFSYMVLFQINTEKEKVFLDSIVNRRLADAKDPCYCLSKELGVYSLEEYDYPKGLFRQMVEDGIIVKILLLYDPTDSIWRGDHIEYENKISNFPYYVYHQPYRKSFPIKRLSIPKYPLKIEQFPIEQQRNALRLPFRFKDTDSFFIQQYRQSRFFDGPIKGPADYDKR